MTILLIIAVLAGLPGAWLFMLALGNFGFAQFGFVDCLPVGVLIGMLASND